MDEVRAVFSGKENIRGAGGDRQGRDHRAGKGPSAFDQHLRGRDDDDEAVVAILAVSMIQNE
ncbi:MAG: hypothetical protein M9883_04590 [Methylobacteriaceae bacterium]|nr:hypothetical protein [Methylobacteriaceae bacterium]